MDVEGYDNIPVTSILEPLAVRILIAVAREVGQPGCWVTYCPAFWFSETPSVRRRKRWSRMVRFLGDKGFLARQVDPKRDRVRQIAITQLGWQWVVDNCGPGAFLPLEDM